MLDQLKDLIVNYVDVDPDDISEDSQFIADLGFNSYDFMSFLGDIEDEFEIEIDEREVINVKTVGEAVKYIEQLQN
ncbi:MAG: phosphopantetheine-binding protein [Clostridia bacterium]|nr:phosphopantetheine-binding protein [Clostridia bacterium]